MLLYLMTTPTPVGDFHLISEHVTERRSEDLVYASGFGSLSDLLTRLPQALRFGVFEKEQSTHPYGALAEAYFRGDKHALEQIPVKQDGTEFYQRVWKAMSAVPYGQTASYKDLAQAVGSPNAVRAVGTTCGRNRLALLVPCHRVIRTDGSRGKYLYGDTIKNYLLDLEQRMAQPRGP